MGRRPQRQPVHSTEPALLVGTSVGGTAGHWAGAGRDGLLCPQSDLRGPHPPPQAVPSDPTSACVTSAGWGPPRICPSVGLQAGALTGTANQHIPDLWLWYGFKEACDSVQSEWISGFLLGMLGQKWLLVSGSFWH